MESTITPDNVLHNILSRLSAKPLMRFRCASKHWNGLITDPYFINSISRRMILMRFGLTLYAFDTKHSNIVKLTYPFEHQIDKCNIIGTLNGIVLLVLEKYYAPRIFVLYNPLTRATKKLPGLPYLCGSSGLVGCAYGFGHGNIITINYWSGCPYCDKFNNCSVFNLEKGSWTKPKTNFEGRKFDGFVDKVGVFLNGFLHWISWFQDVFDIMVLDIREMVFTRMDAPRLTINYNRRESVLGTLHGCLCMSNMWSNGFDVWVKERNEWSKLYSLALPFYQYGCEKCLDVSILEDGRILVKDEVSNQIIMCHQFERYYDIFEFASEIRVTNRYDFNKRRNMYVLGKPFEYIESLVSPSDICHD